MIYRLPPLNALRVFEAAARHLSFKAAAVELSITQAAVSHQVKSLEEYLGVELFRRSGRGVRLTEAARACLPKLREGFDALAAAVEQIRERAGDAELQITAPPVFAARWLMPRLAAFAKREPRIDVRVVASSKMVDAGALDSPTLMSGLDLRDESSGVEIHLGAGEYPGYRADKLFEVSTAVVAAPDLLATLKKPEDLANHLLLHDDAMNLVAGGDAWRKWLEAAGVADRVEAAVGRISRRTSCRSRRPPRSSASRSPFARWWTPTSPPGAWWRRSRSSSSRNRPITLYVRRLSPAARR